MTCSDEHKTPIPAIDANRQNIRVRSTRPLFFTSDIRHYRIYDTYIVFGSHDRCAGRAARWTSITYKPSSWPCSLGVPRCGGNQDMWTRSRNDPPGCNCRTGTAHKVIRRLPSGSPLLCSLHTTTRIELLGQNATITTAAARTQPSGVHLPRDVARR